MTLVYQVTVFDRRANAERVECVRVHQDSSKPQAYYATGGGWGCGKMADTPANAIALLVQDMAAIISVKKV